MSLIGAVPHKAAASLLVYGCNDNKEVIAMENKLINLLKMLSWTGGKEKEELLPIISPNSEMIRLLFSNEKGGIKALIELEEFYLEYFNSSGTVEAMASRHDLCYNVCAAAVDTGRHAHDLLVSYRKRGE